MDYLIHTYRLGYPLPRAGFVVGLSQLRWLSKSAPMRKRKLLAGERHRSSGLLMLCCAPMCVSTGQWVMMCVEIMGVSLTVNAGLVDGVIDSLSVKWPDQCAARNEAC